MTDDLVKTLQQLVEEYGIEILEDPDRLLQFLDDDCNTAYAVRNFRFTFALHAVIKAGWKTKENIYGVKREFYINKLVEELAFNVHEAESFLNVLCTLTQDETVKESYTDGVVAHPGNLKKVSGGIANHPRTMWLRKKIFYNGILLFVAFVAITILFFQIGKQRNPVGAEFRIAFVAPISADGVFGQTQLKAAQLAVDKINRQGGVRGFKLKIIGLDVPNDSNVVVQKVKSLLQDKSILLMLTSLNGETAKKISEVAECMEIPLIMTSTQLTKDAIDSCSRKPFLYSFRLAGNTDETARLMVYYAIHSLKGRRIALMWRDDDTYSYETAEAVRKWAHTYGRRIVADIGHKDGCNNYTLALKTVKESGADILLLPGSAEHVQDFLAQADVIGFKGKIVGSNLDEALFWNTTTDTAIRSWWLNPLSLSDPQVLSVMRDYKKLYNENCNLSVAQEAIFVYDAVHWAAFALYRAPGYRGEAIRHGLLATRNLALTHATLTTDPRTHGPLDKAYALLSCSHGKSIFQKRLSVKTTL